MSGWSKMFVLVLACIASLACNAGAEQIKIGGTGSALATMKWLAEAYQQSHPEDKIVVLPSLGSGGGIKAVLAGAIQIALSSRPLKPSEVGQGAIGQEIGRTPFAFVVAQNVQAEAITEQDLAEIYSAKRVAWSDGTRIRIILRPTVDSDTAMVESISPAIKQATTEAARRSGMVLAVTDQDNANYLVKIPGAFGTMTLAQINSEHLPLKALRFNGVEACTAAVAEGKYPLSKPLVLVIAPGCSPAARQFVDFINSPSGREILAKVGYMLPAANTDPT